MSVWNKLDGGLAAIYSSYLRLRRDGAKGHLHPIAAAGEPVHLTLQYKGDLSGIEGVGFRTIFRAATGEATGLVELGDLETVALHPGVIHMSVGESVSFQLDHSIPDIRADQVWTKTRDASTVAFTGLTGNGVIVGIIDSGIDLQHPFMLKTLSPMATRLLRHHRACPDAAV